MSIVTVLVVLFVFCGAHCYYYDDNTPRYLTGAIGGYIVFDCEVDFPQDFAIPYRVHWRRGGEEIFRWEDGRTTESDQYVGRIRPVPEDHRQFYGGASINLTSIRETDAGWFECRVIFPNRTPQSRNNGTWFHLTVSGGNLLAIPPMNQTVLEGQEARLNCVTKDYMIKLKWLKDGIPLEEYQDLLQRSWVDKDGTLVIHRTDMGDNGEYECWAYNEEGETQSAKAYLNIQYKAKVVYAPPEINLAFGRSAIIDCHFRANPPLTNLHWEKDGFLFDPYNVQGVFYRRNGSLYFNRVDESHSGKYTCTPYNDLGTQGPSPIMHIVVRKAPLFTKTPLNLYLKKLGDSIELPCEAKDGDDGHVPMITWYKKGSALPLGRYIIKNGNLTITDIQEEDGGVYQCSASNKAAAITAETELLVDTASKAPYNLNAVSSPNSVHLTWKAGMQRANMDYHVWYKKVESMEWKTHLVSSVRSLEATIKHLEPGTEYEFMVVCKDDSGDGIFSKALRISTKPNNTEISRYSIPIGYPRNITVQPTDEGLFVSWLPPKFGLENLKWYIIRWTRVPDDYTFGSADTSDTTYTITNLEEGSEYDIQVLALSIDDQQAVSAKVRGFFPGSKTIRAVSTGIIVGLMFLVFIFLSMFYLKRRRQSCNQSKI